MGNKLLLGAQAVMLTAVVALALPGCFTVGDDDDNGDSGSGGESGAGANGGSSGSSGKGGSSSKGGTSGSGTGGTDVPAKGGSSGTGGSCLADGASCTQNGDCCSFTLNDGVCVGGMCAPGCTVDQECESGCCGALESGGSACAPATICSGSCLDDGETCATNGDCCSYANGAGYCISDLDTCVPSCKTNDDCTTGCCVALEGLDDGACAPAKYCAN